MKLSGGALTRGKVSCLCILFLGFTAGTGLTYTEANGNGVSGALAKIGGWISEILKNEGSSSETQVPLQPFDPITPITKTWEKVSEMTKTVVGFVPTSYTWIRNSDNSQWMLGFFKNFLDLSFVKNVLINFHFTVRAWLGVLSDKDILSKLSEAIKKFQSLAKFLSQFDHQAQQDGEKTMINWLYLRLFVNPRRTINVLARGQRANSKEGDDGLKCNGAGKGKKGKGENLPLGVCFICPNQNKLIDHIVNFLKKGEMPQTKKKEK